MFRKKFRPVHIVLNTWSFILFKFVLWYTLFLFCVEFKIVLYQFLYRCGHKCIANQTISDSFLEMCSPVKFAHSLLKKSRTVSSWELCTRIILQSMFVNQQMVKRNSNGRLVIKSSDNDVLLLSLHFYSKMTNIDELRFQTGSKANFTGLHISKNESDIVWLAISDKLKWPHRNKN
jgi:hypothetical protein